MLPLNEEDLKLDVHLHEAELNAEKNQHNKPNLGLLNEQLLKEAAREGAGDDPHDHESEENRRKRNPWASVDEEFVRRRAEHYSEFKKIQEAKKKHLWEDD